MKKLENFCNDVVNYWNSKHVKILLRKNSYSSVSNLSVAIVSCPVSCPSGYLLTGGHANFVGNNVISFTSDLGPSSFETIYTIC